MLCIAYGPSGQAQILNAPLCYTYLHIAQGSNKAELVHSVE
jgi:hypothetical protein